MHFLDAMREMFDVIPNDAMVDMIDRIYFVIYI